MVKGIYKKALENKQYASDILLPLIEFEFGFLSNDSPDIIQSPKNEEQFKMLFDICKKHGWTTIKKKKGHNLFFRISKKGFKEIYEASGPFASSKKREWASLILERYGKIGGYQVNKAKTDERVLKFLKERNDWTTLQQICLNLRILPGTVREGIKKLKNNNHIERKREGKAAYWRIKRSFPEPH